MGNLKDAHVFSNEEGSIAKFFIAVAFFVLAGFTGELISYDYMREPFYWWRVLLLYLCLAAIATAIYFISRFLAYRTKVFPKAKYRESIHGVSFFFLMILSVVLLLVFT